MTPEHRAEIEAVATRGGSVVDLSAGAYQALYGAHYHEMPYGTAKARTGDPDEWLDGVLPDYAPTNRPADGRVCDCEDAPCCGHYEL